MFDRPSGGERVALVHINFHRTPISADLEEFEGLAKATSAVVVGTITGTRDAPDAKTFIGKGKVEEVRALVASEDVQLVVFNHELSPAQERNLEKELKARVVGRSGLILDIFALRARTFEGKLQVELAQLQHLSTRLVRGWTHLERQKGGIGLRGPGETQLESDRRLLRARIETIHRRLAKVRRGREVGRKARAKNHVPTVALVGYTNAGKSTLFNHLTGAQVFVADQLFATLDPTLRTVLLPGFGKVVLGDTVGFIRQLPHELVDAFRATLEETRQANLLLHVVDASDDNWAETQAIVNDTLEDIGAGEVEQLVVMNKIDAIGKAPTSDATPEQGAQKVWLSAHTGAGLDLLKDALLQRLSKNIRYGWLKVMPENAALRAALYESEVVLTEKISDEGQWHLEVQANAELFDQLSAKFKVKLQWIETDR